MILRTPYLPFRLAGICLWKGLLIVRRDAPESVVAHEHVHENEWSPLWLLKYLLSPVFRMQAEVRAYTVQAELEGVPLSTYYPTIRDCYMLNSRAKDTLVDLVYKDTFELYV
jgi:hypothetical protein